MVELKLLFNLDLENIMANVFVAADDCFNTQETLHELV